MNAHLVQRQEVSRQLVGLADLDVRRVALDEKDDTQVHLRDGGRLLVQKAQQIRLETPVVDDLLRPLALQPVEDRVAALQVARNDMASDTERVLLAQPLFRGGTQTMSQEVAIAVPEHDVRDDLLEARVVLHFGARLEEVALADHTLMAFEVVGHETVPCAVGKDVLPPHHQDLLCRDRHGTIRTRPRPNTAMSSAVRSTSSSGTGRK